MTSEFRNLPSVDKLLDDPVIKQLEESGCPHELVVKTVRRELDAVRKSIAGGKKSPPPDEILSGVQKRIQSFVTPTLKPVINATGVILHTNLGRSPLSDDAIAAMSAVSSGYSNLEFDLDSGSRGSRQSHIENLLCEITGAEAGIVVNNNAAAVLLGLSAHARRKEIIVSRGQAVEIGDSFRIPDVMHQSGAKLVEVGTTNCTYPRDYENAVTPSTAALLRVHSSNFKVVGFTNEVSIEELVSAGNKLNLPVFDDEGSGCLIDTTAFGLAEEPMVQKSIAAGSALVFFSGDKLVGGPQAGIIVGKKPYIDKLRKHPLARVVRIDKFRIAALHATLLHYLKGEATKKIPVWQMISASISDIETRARDWAKATNGMGSVVDGESMVGGGSLPGGTLQTRLVAIKGEGKTTVFVQNLAKELRQANTPVIGRISGNTFFLDPRSTLPRDDELLKKTVSQVLTNSNRS